MAKGTQAQKYYVVDAFAESPLKGNPAAVCVLDTEQDIKWMKAVSREFNLSATCFLFSLPNSYSSPPLGEKTTNTMGVKDQERPFIPTFRLRWFAPDAELNICGHGTIASAYVLFSTGVVKSDKIEFHTNAGIMVAERIPTPRLDDDEDLDLYINDYENGKRLSNFIKGNDFSVRLAFPLIPVVACDDHVEKQLIPRSMNVGAPGILNTAKMAYEGELIVEYCSGNDVMELKPSVDEIRRWPGRGVIATGAAPPGSGFDFYSRFFCPNLGMIEDPVCGSVHCGLAPYWTKKLGKNDLLAYMASPRGGTLVLHVDDKSQRVLIQGKAAPVMEGLLYA